MEVTQHYLRQDNPSNDPDIQILAEYNLEEENKEERQYWCAICQSKLDYIKNMDMWYCSACVQYYDTKIQDVPIKDLSESKVRVSAELQHYPTYGENDIYSPFIEAINPDSDETEIPSNIEIVSDDGHRKHIRVKGLPIEALSAMREQDGRE
ncbi:MAG: hypothetical protein ACRD8W_07715 [Nitrososphaeraceae archaeon]